MPANGARAVERSPEDIAQKSELSVFVLAALLKTFYMNDQRGTKTAAKQGIL